MCYRGTAVDNPVEMSLNLVDRPIGAKSLGQIFDGHCDGVRATPDAGGLGVFQTHFRHDTVNHPDATIFGEKGEIPDRVGLPWSCQVEADLQ